MLDLSEQGAEPGGRGWILSRLLREDPKIAQLLQDLGVAPEDAADLHRGRGEEQEKHEDEGHRFRILFSSVC